MLQKIIDKALELGFEAVEIIETVSDEVTISLFRGNVDKNFNGSDKSYTLKGIINGKMALTHFQKNEEELSDKEIEKIILKLKDNVLTLNAKEESSIFEGSKVYPTVETVESGISEVPTKKKIAMLKEMEKASYGYDERIELVNYCQYVEERSSTKIVNSKGLNLSKSSEICGFVLGTVAGESKDNPNKQNGFKVEISNKFADLKPKEVAKKACKKAISMLGAAPIESGAYPVILENDAMKSILSGFFSMFSGEAALKKLTSLTDKLGQKIMSEKVTIIDDPLLPESINKEPFDQEGVATVKKEVVSNGVFNSFLHNLKTAKVFGVESTGNATVNGVGPTNFYLQPGTLTKEEMIKKIDKGLLITDMSGLHAGLNPISGDFSAQSSGFYIEKGKIVKPVTLIVVSGNFLKMMNDIVEIGNDLEIKQGGIGAPSVWFNQLAVSGK